MWEYYVSIFDKIMIIGSFFTFISLFIGAIALGESRKVAGTIITLTGITTLVVLVAAIPRELATRKACSEEKVEYLCKEVEQLANPPERRR